MPNLNSTKNDFVNFPPFQRFMVNLQTPPQYPTDLAVTNYYPCQLNGVPMENKPVTHV